MALRDLFTRKPPANDQPISDSGRAHVSGFLQLEEVNATLSGPQGMAVFDQMWRTDPDVRRAVRMAANPIVTATWSVEPYGGDETTDADQKIAENLEWALGLGAQGATSPLRPRWQGHLNQAVIATMKWGFCPFEITWTTAQGPADKKQLVTPSRIGMRLPRTIYRWLLDENHDLEAVEQFLPLRGYVTLPRSDLLYYVIDAEGDNYEGTSMLRPCYKPWKLKDVVERLDAIAQERESVGLPVVFPPRAGNTSPAVLADLEVKLQNVRAGEQAYLIMPGPEASTVKDQGGWTFRIEGLGGSKGGRDPSKTLEYHRDAIAAAFIEEFMRLGQSGVGARATADVQEGPFNMACETVGQIFEDEVNEILIPRWVALNYGPDTPLPTLSMSMAEEPLEDLRDYVSVLVQAGVLTPDGILEDFLRARADLPPADEAVRAQMQAQQEAQRKAATDLANDPASHKVPDPTLPGAGPAGKAATDKRPSQPKMAPASGASRGDEDAFELAFNPDEPRDWHGRWGEGSLIDLRTAIQGLKPNEGLRVPGAGIVRGGPKATPRGMTARDGRYFRVGGKWRDSAQIAARLALEMSARSTDPGSLGGPISYPSATQAALSDAQKASIGSEEIVGYDQGGRPVTGRVGAYTAHTYEGERETTFQVTKLSQDEDAVLLDTPGRSNGYSGDGTWPTTSGKAGVDGVPTPDTWHCPCGNAGCTCETPVECTFVPSVDSSYNIDMNPKRRRRNAGDGTKANQPDAVDPPGGRTL